MTNTDFTITVSSNNIITLEKTTLKKAISTILFELEIDPLILSFSNKQLYFNKSVFTEYLNNEIDSNELIEITETDGLFRNTNTISFENKLDVDTGALWTKKGNQLFLVDDEWNIVVKFDTELFTQI